MTTKLRGINIAMATPMSEDGEALDLPRLESHIDWLIEKGVHGIVVAGSTGEFFTLTDDERRTLVETTIKHVDRRIPVTVHCAGQSTTETVYWARHAYDNGADALMCVPPWYAPPTEEEVFHHYKAIDDAVPLDMILYNIPGHSGFAFSQAFTRRMATELQHCTYIKDSSGDFRGLQATMMECGDVITVFNGIDDLSFQGFASGAPGTVWGAVNVMPAESVRLFKLLNEDRDLDTAWELWKRMWPLCRFFEAHDYAAAIKTGMQLIGQDIGAPRRPGMLLEGEERAQLAQLLEALAPVPV